jgi:hypothetical protein
MGEGSGLAAFLARGRVPIGFFFAAVALGLARPSPRSLAAGGAIAVAGEALRIWAAGHLEKSREVTMSGPYRMMRHPLYVGSTIMGAGLAVASARPLVAALIAIYLAATLTAAIRMEEARLERLFGHTYGAYREGRAPSVRRQFSLARVVRNKEYRAVAGLAGVFAILAWKTWGF